MYIALWSNFGSRMLRHSRIGPRWNSLLDAVRRRARRTPLPFPFPVLSHYCVTRTVKNDLHREDRRTRKHSIPARPLSCGQNPWARLLFRPGNILTSSETTP